MMSTSQEYRCYLGYYSTIVLDVARLGKINTYVIALSKRPCRFYMISTISLKTFSFALEKSKWQLTQFMLCNDDLNKLQKNYSVTPKSIDHGGMIYWILNGKSKTNVESSSSLCERIYHNIKVNACNQAQECYLFPSFNVQYNKEKKSRKSETSDSSTAMQSLDGCANETTINNLTTNNVPTSTDGVPLPMQKQNYPLEQQQQRQQNEEEEQQQQTSNPDERNVDFKNINKTAGQTCPKETKEVNDKMYSQNFSSSIHDMVQNVPSVVNEHNVNDDACTLKEHRKKLHFDVKKKLVELNESISKMTSNKSNFTVLNSRSFINVNENNRDKIQVGQSELFSMNDNCDDKRCDGESIKSLLLAEKPSHNELVNETQLSSLFSPFHPRNRFFKPNASHMNTVQYSDNVNKVTIEENSSSSNKISTTQNNRDAPSRRASSEPPPITMILENNEKDKRRSDLCNTYNLTFNPQVLVHDCLVNNDEQQQQFSQSYTDNVQNKNKELIDGSTNLSEKLQALHGELQTLFKFVKKKRKHRRNKLKGLNLLRQNKEQTFRRCSSNLLELLKKLEAIDQSNVIYDIKKETSIVSAYDIVNGELITKLKALEDKYKIETQRKIELARQILHQELWKKVQRCSSCQRYGILSTCNACLSVYYCNKKCQLDGWHRNHGIECNKTLSNIA